MDMIPHDSLKHLFQAWSIENPAHLHKAQLRALDNACTLFGEISNWPYDEVPSEMLDTFISSRQSDGSRRNMLYLISALDLSVRDNTDPEFSHPEMNDAHLIWLMLHLRFAVQVDSIRARILSMQTDYQPFEVFAAKYLAGLYGTVVEATVNLRRNAILMNGRLFGTSATALTNDIIEEIVASAPKWISSSMRVTLKGIVALASDCNVDQVVAIRFPTIVAPANRENLPVEPGSSLDSQTGEFHSKEETNPLQITPELAHPQSQASFYELWDASLRNIHEIWLQQCAPSLAKNSQQKLNTGWNVLRPLWDKLFREIKISEVQDLLLQVPATTQRSAKEIYVKLEELAFSMDIVDRKRAHLLEREEIILQPRIPLSDVDIENLWTHQGEWYVDITLVLYYTGFRAGELVKLKKTDVDLHRLEIIGGSKTQFGVNRVIPIHQKIEPIIRKWLSEEPGEYLIPQESGKRFSNRDIEHAVKMATAAYCVQPHIPHECRHTFYTNLERNDSVSPACLAHLAGHNPRPLPVGIRVYSMPTPDQRRAAIHVL